MGQKVGGAVVPLSVGGAGSPSNNVAWTEAYLRTKWHLDPSRVQTFGNKDVGRKLRRGLKPLGQLGHHLVQCCLGRGLPPYQVVS